MANKLCVVLFHINMIFMASTHMPTAVAKFRLGSLIGKGGGIKPVLSKLPGGSKLFGNGGAAAGKGGAAVSTGGGAGKVGAGVGKAGTDAAAGVGKAGAGVGKVGGDSVKGGMSSTWRRTKNIRTGLKYGSKVGGVGGMGGPGSGYKLGALQGKLAEAPGPSGVANCYDQCLASCENGQSFCATRCDAECNDAKLQGNINDKVKQPPQQNESQPKLLSIPQMPQIPQTQQMQEMQQMTQRQQMPQMLPIRQQV